MAESRSPGRYLAPALVACAAATAPHAGASRAAELTIDRLFDAPALAGPSIVGLQISPDGSRVTYLQGKPEDKDRLDLWEYDLTRTPRAAAGRFAGSSRRPMSKLSDEELGRRERQRTAALSGILEYSFAPSGRALLFPLDGRALLLRSRQAARRGRCCKSRRAEAFATDATISPRGRYVAYVRDQNLYVYDLAARRRKGADPAMGAARSRTAWRNSWRRKKWTAAPATGGRPTTGTSPSRASMKARSRSTQRFEIAADNVATFAQRYPAAGGPNVLDPPRGERCARRARSTWIDLGPDPGHLSRTRELAARRQDARHSARKPRPAPAGSAVRQHRHRREPRGADRDQRRAGSS